jgi:tetratricopeptide (TPR) repeat protein
MAKRLVRLVASAKRACSDDPVILLSPVLLACLVGWAVWSHFKSAQEDEAQKKAAEIESVEKEKRLKDREATDEKAKLADDEEKLVAEREAAEMAAQKLAEEAHQRGREHAKRDEFGTALTCLTESLTHRDTYEAHNMRAFCYVKLKRYREAENDYAACIRLQSASTPSTVKALDFSNRGSVRIWLRDVDGAITDFDAALIQDPGLADAYAGRGLARSSKGQEALAIADFTTGIRLACENVSINDTKTKTSGTNQKISQMYRDRATAYRATGNYQKAQDDEKNAKLWDSRLNP